MFLGHFAVGFAAKRVAPRVSLGVAFAASQWLDLVWPVLVLAGVETVRVDPGATAFTPLDFEHYPWSHSLMAAIAWAAAWAIACLLLQRSRREALVMALVVLSHYLLDVISHRPDLPLGLGDGLKVGLGLWRSVTATVVVEGALFVCGLGLYLRTTRACSRKGAALLWSLVGFLVLVYLANAFGPKPTVGTPAAAIAGPALAMWLLVGWAQLADRHRQLRLGAA